MKRVPLSATAAIREAPVTSTNREPYAAMPLAFESQRSAKYAPAGTLSMLNETVDVPGGNVTARAAVASTAPSRESRRANRAVMRCAFLDRFSTVKSIFFKSCRSIRMAASSGGATRRSSCLRATQSNTCPKSAR